MIKILGIAHPQNVESIDIDREKIRDLLLESSAVFLECAENNVVDELEFVYNKSSMGKELPESIIRLIRSPFLNALKGIRKSVYLERSPFRFGDFSDLERLYQDAFVKYASGMPDKSFKSISKFILKLVNECEKRDAVVVSQLANLQDRYNNENILVLFGQGHIKFLSTELQKLGYNTEVVAFPSLMQGFLDDAFYSQRYDKKFNKDAIVKIMPESMLEAYLCDLLAYPYIESRKIAHNAASRLDYLSSSNLSKYLGRYTSSIEEVEVILASRMEDLGHLKI